MAFNGNHLRQSYLGSTTLENSFGWRPRGSTSALIA